MAGYPSLNLEHKAGTIIKSCLVANSRENNSNCIYSGVIRFYLSLLNMRKWFTFIKLVFAFLN